MFCLYISIGFLLIFVPLKESYFALTPPVPQRQFPKFEFSKNLIKKTKKLIVLGFYFLFFLFMVCRIVCCFLNF